MADKSGSSVKKPNIFVRSWRKLREAFSELRKVTWPTFGKTLKQLGIVLVVVAFFLIVITAINYGLWELYQFVFQVGKYKI